MGDSSALPPEVRAAWGLVPATRRGARPELSLERIVAAAVSLADADGLAAVSMARIAAQLGFSTMSLYRHVGSKDELLEHMQDHAVGPPPRDATDGLNWRDGMAVWCREMLDQYLGHPWMLDVPISGPPLMPRSLEWMDWAMGVMSDVPLLPYEKLSTLMLFIGLIRNEAAMVVGIWRDGTPEPDEDVVYEDRLKLLVTPDALPALHALVTEGLFSGATEDAAEGFSLHFGLDRVLDGIQVLIDSRR